MRPATTWSELLTLIDAVGQAGNMTVRQCAEIVHARSVEGGPYRFRLRGLDGPYKGVDVGADPQGRVTFVVIEPLDRDGRLAAEVRRLGPPQDIDVVSPQLRVEGAGGPGPDWTHRFSVTHLLHGQTVQCGIEARREGERLEYVRLR